LSGLNKTELKTALDTLAESYAERIPKVELLLAISNSEEIIGLEEWYEAFQGHISWVAEAELAWPAAMASLAT
jgi:hypothetical protein